MKQLKRPEVSELECESTAQRPAQRVQDDAESVYVTTSKGKAPEGGGAGPAKRLESSPVTPTPSVPTAVDSQDGVEVEGRRKHGEYEWLKTTAGPRLKIFYDWGGDVECSVCGNDTKPRDVFVVCGCCVDRARKCHNHEC